MTDLILYRSHSYLRSYWRLWLLVEEELVFLKDVNPEKPPMSNRWYHIHAYAGSMEWAHWIGKEGRKAHEAGREKLWVL